MNTSSFPRCVSNPFCWWMSRVQECNFKQMSGIPFCWFQGKELHQTLLTGKGKSQGLLTLLACSSAFPQGGMQNTSQPHSSRLSPSPGGCCALVSAWPLRWSSGSAAANRAARQPGQPSSISLSVFRLCKEHPHHSSSLSAMTWTPALHAVISEA